MYKVIMLQLWAGLVCPNCLSPVWAEPPLVVAASPPREKLPKAGNSDVSAAIVKKQVGGVISRNAKVDNAVLEVALEHEFGTQEGKRVIERKNFPAFIPHNPRFVMGDLARIQQEYDKAGRNGIDYPPAYEEALQRAFPGCTSCASADLPRYRLDGTALIALHWVSGHPISATFEMHKHGGQWKIIKYSFSVML